MALNLNNREQQLITSALYRLECDCYGDELHFETVKDLGGTPEPDEVRTLMDKVEQSS